MNKLDDIVDKYHRTIKGKPIHVNKSKTYFDSVVESKKKAINYLLKVRV